MVAGRPRTVTFSDDEMENLGQEMLDWIIARPETLHLSQWYTIEKMFTYNEWKTFLQCKKFLPYYEKALKLVGLNYLNKDSKVRDGISQRWQRVYFKDLRESEDQDAEEEAERKKSIESSKPSQVVVKVSHDGLGAGLGISAENISNSTNKSP